MLRKRNRSSHQKDQHAGHLMSDIVSEKFDVLGQKHKTNSFFNVPGLFVGFNSKGPESDSVRSPTSPLDFRVFSNLGNPFRSPRSSNEGNQKRWDCSKVGLSIIDSLEDDTKQSGKVLRSSDSRNILFGPQMRIKTPNFVSRIDSFEASKSLPKNYAIFPHTQTKLFNLQIGSSNVLFGIGEAPLEPESSEKIRSCSLDSRRSGSHLTSLTNIVTYSSSGIFCPENGINPVSQPSHLARGSPSLSNSVGTTLTSIPVSIGGNSLIEPLSQAEIELSEDYTCVRTRGPNPKTTHIFGDCILECHNNEFANFSKNEEQEVALPQEVKFSEDPASYPSSGFLSFCYSCNKKLEGEDIYMYRGEKAFCSWTCRSEEILFEEEMEKTDNVSSEKSVQLNACDELFENGLFIAT
ncbi:unnamed protein product [Ilex paraguariensis]|uniref:FLZ-type domain-containing protein n=1 Tax=Ilex paraguariensis TaxID=185542 RepID=A0ABC8T519_9AQUA